MTTRTFADDEWLIKAIRDRIDAVISAVIEEAVAGAMKTLDERLASERAAIALSLLSHYSVERMGAEIRIIVHDKRNVGE